MGEKQARVIYRLPTQNRKKDMGEVECIPSRKEARKILMWKEKGYIAARELSKYRDGGCAHGHCWTGLQSYTKSE